MNYKFLSFHFRNFLTPIRTLRFASNAESKRPSLPESVAEKTLTDSSKMEVDVSGGVLSKIDINPEIQRQKIKLTPEKFDDAKLLRVAIIGKTNSGKSTLTNALTGATVSAVSKKIHTTRKITKGILVEDKTQLIFLDTPGFFTGKLKKKYKIEKELYRDQEESLKSGEIFLVLHDVSNEYTCNRLDSRILHLLYRYKHVPSILVLNKIDELKRQSKVLDIIHNLTKSRVNDQILQRKKSKIFKMAEDHEKKNKLTEIVTAYRAKRLAADEKESLKLLQNVSKKDEFEPKSDADGVLSTVNELKNDEEQKNATENDPKKVQFDKTLWKVDYETLEKIADKPLHEIPLNQLRKCYLHEQGWPYFKAVFSISALYGNGIQRLAEYLVGQGKPNSWKYHSSIITPSNPTELAKESVRSRMLDVLPSAFPYTLTYQVNFGNLFC